jgi:transposase-like protein
MRGQHRPIPWHESAVELDALYQQECNDQRRVRSQALWLLRQGHTIGTVSQAVDVNYQTVQRWIR